MTSTDDNTPVVVIGAGPAGLMAAETIARGGARVAVFDAMPSAGRKFLLAGRGGLNLTHSELIDAFLARYGEGAAAITAAIRNFPPQALRDWADALGQDTFVGSSGRVFPKQMKSSPLLRAWLQRLDAKGVQLNLRHRWRGWGDGGQLAFAMPEGERLVAARAVVLALGGASWPRLGSDGAWADGLRSKSVSVAPFRPANCGFRVEWSEPFRERFVGTPLKNIALSFDGRSMRGEAIVTRDGIEGGAVYALSRALRETIDAGGEADLCIALRPDVFEHELTARLATPRGKQSFATYLRKALRLSPPAIGLMQEAAHRDGTNLAGLSPQELARFVNAVPVPLTGTASIARAISTAGGIALDQLDDSFMLRTLPGMFAAGEMLDWEAPTGGYLLQASFATGVAAGNGVLRWLAK